MESKGLLDTRKDWVLLGISVAVLSRYPLSP
jgi:hypothetical protein